MQTTKPDEKNGSAKCEEVQVTETKTSTRPPKSPRGYQALLKGFAWNPLLTLPRNRPCPCLSGKKFKACCLNRLPKAIPEKLVSIYREQMSKPDLVFVTPTNQEKLKAMGLKIAAEKTEEK